MSGAEGGNLDAIAEKALAHGVNWVAVKCADGGSLWGQFRDALGLQGRGLKVYSWSYNYGGDGEDIPILRNMEIAMDSAQRGFGNGIDGHIFDIEAEFARLPDAPLRAAHLLASVLARYPEANLAYAPLPVIDNFPGLPYETFNGKGLLVLPQFYTKALGTGVEYTLERLMGIWREWVERWLEKPFAIYPVLQGYGEQTPENLRREGSICMERYGGFSVWAWHTLTDEMWEAIRDA